MRSRCSTVVSATASAILCSSSGAGQSAGNVLHAPVERAFDALGLLVRHVDFAHGGGFAAANTDPSRTRRLPPRRREWRSASCSAHGHESGRHRDCPHALEKTERPRLVSPHASVVEDPARAAMHATPHIGRGGFARHRIDGVSAVPKCGCDLMAAGCRARHGAEHGSTEDTRHARDHRRRGRIVSLGGRSQLRWPARRRYWRQARTVGCLRSWRSAESSG